MIHISHSMRSRHFTLNMVKKSLACLVDINKCCNTREEVLFSVKVPDTPS